MNLRVLLSYAAPYRGSLLVSTALMLLGSLAALAMPWLGGELAGVVLSHQESSLRFILLGLLALFAAQAVLQYSSSYILSRISERIVADLRIRIYEHLQALPLRFYQSRRRGEILSLITYEVGQLSAYISGTLPSIFPLLLTATGSVVLMFRIDASLTVLVAALIPIFYVILKLAGRRLRPLALKSQRAEATAVATAEENFNMLPVIKAFTREAYELQKYTGQIDDAMNLSIAQQRIYAALGPATQFLAAAAVVLVLWLASPGIDTGEMSPSDLVSFLLYAALLSRPVGALSGVYGQTQLTRGALQHFQSVIEERPEAVLAGGKALPDSRGAIEFRHIGFAYPGRPPALSDVSLTIRPGETVALTGENGSGKSTLIHLLSRLHEPDTGQILIDGIDIAGVSLHSLRSQIGVVPQHVLLANASVLDNIGFGRVGADQPSVENAARLAQAHDFIVSLPQGYETVIGDDGVRLSGGQRQRIALARALIKNPAILVLDEATAMFDPEGEQSFVEQCRKTFANRTVIIITHRPASLALADRTVKFDEGTIVDPI
ncbi:MAG: ABC transporter ATP-binding protein [Hyphomicrobiales bacterium]|nr:ABC transporter ATP-binding protein [Hyphomicrobiales bacterium]